MNNNVLIYSLSLGLIGSVIAAPSLPPYLSIGGEYTHELTAVLDGGINQRSSHRELLVLEAELDLEKFLGIKNSTLFAQFQHATTEKGGTLDAGDLQAYSNLEVGSSIDELYEFWYQQTFFNEKLRIKVGKVDANSEFNFVELAGGFANSSAGFSPTIFAFPTYPNPAMSVQAFWTFEKQNLTLGYGLYDGSATVDGVQTGRYGPSTFFSSDQSDDYFHILQLERSWDKVNNMGAGRASIGVWHHDGEFTTFDGATDRGTYGGFFTLEQQFTGNSEEQGVFGFFQYAWADEDVSEVAQHIAGGVVFRGNGITRSGDEAGLYVTHADLSDVAAAGFTKNETAIDAYYNIQFNSNFALKPELQYILSPSGSATVDNAFVAGVRAIFTF